MSAQKQLRKILNTICKPAKEGIYISSRPLPELVEDKEAIRAALKESRRQHTKRVTSKLP